MFEIASLIGTVAFALSGYLLGIRKELDIMGLFILAMLTACGGGALRDVLVGETPRVLQNINAFLWVGGTVALAMLTRIHRFPGLERRWIFIISDSVGLVAFAITGALVGVEHQLHLFGVMTLAFLTATGGGILRDMLVNDVPELLGSGFYGSVALIIGAGVWGLALYGWLHPTSLIVLFIAGLTLRLIAHWRGWHLPVLARGKPYLNPPK